MKRLGVIGAGAWGTALATVSVRAGLDTLIWALEEDVVTSINASCENTLYLPDVPLDPALVATSDMADLSDREVILMVAPAQHLRSVAIKLGEHLPAGVPVLICSKGIEVSTGKLMSTVLGETMPDNPVGILGGPTFAAETSRNMVSALTLAMADEKMGLEIVEAIGLPTFRPYFTTDVIGAQIGGAIKNVIAIASGIVAGLGLGENAKAALITRGLSEMQRFGRTRGAKAETLMGLSGVGDLVLTCSSTQSRNMSLGLALGEGQSFKEIMAGRRSVSEGAHTVEVVHKIAVDEGIDMPITEAVYRIIYEGASVDEVMDDLMTRPFTKENS